MSAVYQASHIKRSRATRSQVESRRDAMLDIIAAMRPMTVRQVFYQATVHGIVEKSEAGGLLALHVVRIQDVPNLLGGALSGHADAAHLLTAVNDLLHRIGKAPASRPMQCGCCGADLTPGRFALAIATPDIADPSAGLGMAICRRCGTTLGAIKAAALVALRLIWPDGRFIDVTHSDGGRA